MRRITYRAMSRGMTPRITPLAFVILACLPFNAYPGALPDRLVDYVAERYGDAAKQRLLDRDDLMSNYLHASTGAKRSLANDFSNRIPWQSDLEHRGRADYRATTIEMISTFGGDCEDYSRYLQNGLPWQFCKTKPENAISRFLHFQRITSVENGG